MTTPTAGSGPSHPGPTGPTQPPFPPPPTDDLIFAAVDEILDDLAASFTLPPTPTVPSFGPVGNCPGKVLNDGIAVACGRGVTHYPHGLDRDPGAL